MSDLYDTIEAAMLNSDESDSTTVEEGLRAVCNFAKETGVDLAYVLAEALAPRDGSD
jgi:hypothetical protein